ncbi:WD40 repeat domain-containing protein [Streptomyces mirabilis]|uniref:WD40 repeat domain-containing protein n=1 Tax=Streptomyces mirabilis TaxID=68239 RepID=UPI00333494CE
MGAPCTRPPPTAAPYGDHYRLVVRTVADRKTPLDVPAGPYNVRNLASSPDGKLLTTASDDATLAVWEVSERRVRDLGTHRQR